MPWLLNVSKNQKSPSVRRSIEHIEGALQSTPTTLVPVLIGQLPSLIITEAEVSEQVNIHKRFHMPDSAPGIEVTDLPKFDDFGQYGGASEEVQDALVAKEVSRLVSIILNSHPLNFEGSEKLAVDSSKSHEIFADLCDLFFQSLGVVTYDGECLLGEHEKTFVDMGVATTTHVNLDFICNRDEGDSDPEVGQEYMYRQDFFTLVDYCTAIMARIICANAHSKTTATQMVATLARISAKVKVVSAKIQDFAQISLDHGLTDSEWDDIKRLQLERKGADDSDTERPLLSSPSSTQQPVKILAGTDMFGRGGSMSLNGNSWQPLGLKSKKGLLKKIYFEQCVRHRTGIVDLLGNILVMLNGNSRLQRVSLTSYEISAMVYETGLEHFQTLVFQDQDQNFEGTSDPTRIGCAGHAFHQLNLTVGHIKTQRRAMEDERSISGHKDCLGQSSLEQCSSSIGTRITWTLSHERNGELRSEDHTSQHQKLQLKSMSNVIAVIIPLLFTHPCIAGRLSRSLIRSAEQELSRKGSAKEKIALRPHPRYSAFFCLDTEDYRRGQKSCGLEDARSLSNSLITRNGLLTGKAVGKIGRVGSFPLNLTEPQSSMRFGNSGPTSDSPGGYLEQIKRNQLKLKLANQEMKKWVLEEKGVMVRCRFYVSVVIALCALLVIGGIVIGITVGNRIAGVDPFNVTTYCWVFAAFIVVVCKSVRVHDWPWNDFLYGRVLCKSVSELSSVTGIQDQLIIAYLLEQEPTSWLCTRGPFNVVFRRQKEDGFSIDRPINMWTMLLSGLIGIEVESISGRGLVYLDLRRGTSHYEVSSWRSASSDDVEDLLSCERLNDQRVEYGRPHVKLARNNMEWFRTIGLYGKDNAVFI
ncbi:hypothetical protein B0T21DRAFT_293493 [Apiosordaria backusii]|uniref:Uncharacterized protein n=1 Tax=Apiosordaria backusii TaxID=314023 RepID=A0AA40B2Y5_9PEZI|nr:hypothetical protein B0T21DRAFT_293493 [Apiosordaria backusii]